MSSAISIIFYLTNEMPVETAISALSVFRKRTKQTHEILRASPWSIEQLIGLDVETQLLPTEPHCWPEYILHKVGKPCDSNENVSLAIFTDRDTSAPFQGIWWKACVAN